MPTELDSLHGSVKQAVSPEDFFGIPRGVSLSNTEKLSQHVQRVYHRYARVAHPDKYNCDEAQEIAHETFVLLNRLYKKALAKLESNIYGKGSVDDEEESEFLIQTEKRSYRITNTIAEGDLSTVYRGYCVEGDEEDGRVAVKVVEDEEDNDLMQREIRILRKLHLEASVYGKHLPILLDHFKTTDGQIGTIMRYLDGYDLYSVRDKYPDGIPQEHIIWIFRRVLSALGYAHSLGIIHGNIEPAHIMLVPESHNIYLVDWCYSVYKPGMTGDKFQCYNEDFSAPEVKERKSPIPAADLYSVGKCMVYLLGGDLKTLKMPDSVDKRIQRFIQFFCRESPVQRAQDAWEMYTELDRLRGEVFGSHKFISFEM